MARQDRTSERLRLALRMDQDRAELEKIGARAAARIGRMARIAALRAVRRGGDPTGPVREAFEDLKPLLVDGMVAAHLLGVRRSLIQASRHGGGRIRMSTAYDAALEAIRRQMHLDAADIDRLRSIYGRDAGNVIDTLTNSLNGKVLAKMRELIEQGAHVQEGIRELRKVFEAAGVMPEHSHTLETLFRTHTQMAYAAGRWQVLRSPEVDEILWGFEYVTVGDDRVRPSHAAMDGIRLPKDHAFWQRNFPPNGWNCRCVALEIFEGDEGAGQATEKIKPLVVDGQIIDPVADPGFGFNPGQVFGRAPLRPRLRLPPEEWAKSLSEEEKEALRKWTMLGYEEIRPYQKTGIGREEARRWSEMIERALDRAEPYQGGVVWRGLGNLSEEEFLDWVKSARYTTEAISSSSKDFEIAKGFVAHTEPGNFGILLEIVNNRTGVDITPAVDPSEEEVLLRQGVRYNVLSVEFREWDMINMDLERVRVKGAHIVLEEISDDG